MFFSLYSHIRPWWTCYQEESNTVRNSRIIAKQAHCFTRANKVSWCKYWRTTNCGEFKSTSLQTSALPLLTAASPWKMPWRPWTRYSNHDDGEDNPLWSTGWNSQALRSWCPHTARMALGTVWTCPSVSLRHLALELCSLHSSVELDLESQILVCVRHCRHRHGESCGRFWHTTFQSNSQSLYPVYHWACLYISSLLLQFVEKREFHHLWLNSKRGDEALG